MAPHVARGPSPPLASHAEPRAHSRLPLWFCRPRAGEGWALSAGRCAAWRCVALPLQLLLLLFLLLLFLLPVGEENRSCFLANNFARSLTLMLRYDGPPPT